MKPSFNLHWVLFVTTLSSSLLASAQDLSFRNLNEYRTSGLYASAEASLNLKEDNAGTLSEFKLYSPKAYRNFNRNYKGWKDLHVTQENGETFIFCRINGIVNRIAYDKKGNWHHTIRYYDETKLDNSIRETVANSYKGYEIKGITEVSYAGEMAYLVSIESLRDWKVLRIQNDAMEEIKSFQKSSD